MQDISEMAGFELPDYLGKMKGEAEVDEELKTEPITDEEKVDIEE